MGLPCTAPNSRREAFFAGADGIDAGGGPDDDNQGNDGGDDDAQIAAAEPAAGAAKDVARATKELAGVKFGGAGRLLAAAAGRKNKHRRYFLFRVLSRFAGFAWQAQ